MHELTVDDGPVVEAPGRRHRDGCSVNLRSWVVVQRETAVILLPVRHVEFRPWDVVKRPTPSF